MTEVRTWRRRAIFAVVLSVLALGMALRVRSELSVWVLTGLAGALAIVTALWALGGDLPSRLRINLHTTVVGGIGALVLAGLTWLFYPLVADAAPGIVPTVRDLYASLDDPPGRVWALPILVTVVTAEELIFREVALTRLVDRMPPLRAGAAAVLLYAIPQMIGGSWLLVLLAVGCGAVWTAMRIGTRSLWAPWLCHLGWDLLVFIVHPLETP